MPPDIKGIESLSERQKEILRLAGRHHQTKEIARLLGISEHTIKTHLTEARRRLGGVTTRQAVRLFEEHEGWTPLPQDGGSQERTMVESEAAGPSWTHEQALYSSAASRRTYDDQLRPSGVGLADARSARQAAPYTGRDMVCWPVLLLALTAIVGKRLNRIRQRLKSLQFNF